jgi:hypothetical protein
MGDAYARAAYEEEQRRRQAITAGTRRVQELFSEKYTPQYYDNLKKSATELYYPDQERQYQEAKRQIAGALGRSGMFGSKAAKRPAINLNAANDLAKTKIAQSINAQIAGRKQEVAGAEAAVQGQLQASADQNLAAAQATSQAAARYADPAWQPLGQLFTDITAGLATQADLERSGNNRYNMGISNWGNNLRRYTTNVR